LSAAIPITAANLPTPRWVTRRQDSVLTQDKYPRR